MQFPVQRQVADFKWLAGVLPWRDFANGEMLDSRRWLASASRHAPTGLLRQLFPRLLRHHVGGIPLRPVLVALFEALLVLAVGGLRRSKGARQIVRRCEARRGPRTRRRRRGTPR